MCSDTSDYFGTRTRRPKFRAGHFLVLGMRVKHEISGDRPHGEVADGAGGVRERGLARFSRLARVRGIVRPEGAKMYEVRHGAADQ